MTTRDKKDIALAKAIIAESEKPTGRCQFCGAPAKGGNVCRAHADLAAGVKT